MIASNDTDRNLAAAAIKVPEVVLSFWIVKIAATTLGETAGDAVSMSMHLGYLAASAIFAAAFLAMVRMQIVAVRFQPYRYWLTIIATTTVGTTLADFATRSLGIGYAGGSSLLLGLLLATLFVWYRRLGTIAVASVNSRPAEAFYWLTVMFSQTLGTALGDWTADSAGLGYLGAASLFGAALLFLAVAYYRTQWSRAALFWAAFVLTRPLGAVVGDFLDKPYAAGGLDLSRYAATAVLLLFIVGALRVFPQKPAARAAH